MLWKLPTYQNMAVDILERPEYTKSNSLTRRAEKELLECAISGVFIEFVEELESTIRKAFPAKITKCKKVLAQFHSLSFSGVEKAWEKLYLRELTVNRMMKQYTNDQIIFAEMLLLTLLLYIHICHWKCWRYSDHRRRKYSEIHCRLCSKRKYQKRGSSKAPIFVETLSHMKVSGQEATL